MDNTYLIHPERGMDPTGFVPEVESERGFGTGAKEVPVQVRIGKNEQARMEDNQQCFCKISVMHGKPIYFIKAERNGSVLDPWELYSHPLDKAVAQAKGVPNWKFKRVNESCFNRYLKFLETGNKAHLRLCEREMKDA